MPCPHNEITIVQRSQRQSAVAAAAYQSGEKLFCEYDQQVKHYPEKRGIVHNEILLPPNAPHVYTDSDGSSQSKSIHVQISEDAAPTQIRRYQQELDDAKAEYAELQNARLNEAAEIRKLRTYYDDFKGWAEEFDTAPLEMKRMILSHLIDRVEVGRKYQVIVKFNMKYRQFLECTAETYNTEIGA